MRPLVELGADLNVKNADRNTPLPTPAPAEGMRLLCERWWSLGATAMGRLIAFCSLYGNPASIRDIAIVVHVGPYVRLGAPRRT
eukprot:6751-Pyramimonas_sp.AAC.2